MAVYLMLLFRFEYFIFYSLYMCVYGVGCYVYHIYLGVHGDQKGSTDALELEF